MPLGPGSRLDAYELLQPLGAGGMGEVWLATEVRLGRKVALKLLPAELTRDPARVSRFEQEARAASALTHPNVCTILALGETSEGQHYIAMEYVEGETLRRRIAGGRLTIRDALDHAIQIASALTAAHGIGIVHRDIKPENVMLRPDGFLKVLDFGLAKLAAATDSAAVEATQTAFRTDAGTVVGTVSYMSPEQARGQQVDHRTDIWSLGCVLYEMVAGRSPFAASSSSDTVAAILDREPPPLARFEPDVPSELQRILTKALRKDRRQRYQDVQDLLLDLRVLRDDLHALAPPGSGPVAHGSSPRAQATAVQAASDRPRTQLAWAIAAIVVVAIAAAGVWRWQATAVPPATTASTAPVQRALTRLTFGPGLQTHVTFSPDGRFVAYASDRAGNFDIWVQAVTGGDPVQVTKSPAHDTQPAWSPDGSSLVFRSEREGGGLFLVPALGGVERQLTSFGMHPSWSFSGQEVLFMQERLPTAGVLPERLYVVSPEERAPREILADFFAGGNWFWIGSHPDGRISALGHHPQLGDGFYTVTRDGTRVIASEQSPDLPLRFTIDVGNDYYRRFVWHPSGTALYVQTLSAGVYNLWKVRVDPDTLAFVAAERLTTGAGRDVEPALSRDGTRLAFTTEHDAVRLWLFALDPVADRLGSGRPLTEDRATPNTRRYHPTGDMSPTISRVRDPIVPKPGSRTCSMVRANGYPQKDSWDAGHPMERRLRSFTTGSTGNQPRQRCRSGTWPARYASSADGAVTSSSTPVIG
jgi:eukaryotic-like serine/threonine-protein kinase